MDFSGEDYPTLPASLLGKRRRSREHARKRVEAMGQGVIRLAPLDVLKGFLREGKVDALVEGPSPSVRGPGDEVKVTNSKLENPSRKKRKAERSKHGLHEGSPKATEDHVAVGEQRKAAKRLQPEGLRGLAPSRSHVQEEKGENLRLSGGKAKKQKLSSGMAEPGERLFSSPDDERAIGVNVKKKHDGARDVGKPGGARANPDGMRGEDKRGKGRQKHDGARDDEKQEKARKHQDAARDDEKREKARKHQDAARDDGKQGKARKHQDAARDDEKQGRASREAGYGARGEANAVGNGEGDGPCIKRESSALAKKGTKPEQATAGFVRGSSPQVQVAELAVPVGHGQDASVGDRADQSALSGRIAQRTSTMKKGGAKGRDPHVGGEDGARGMEPHRQVDRNSQPRKLDRSARKRQRLAQQGPSLAGAGGTLATPGSSVPPSHASQVQGASSFATGAGQAPAAGSLGYPGSEPSGTQGQGMRPRLDKASEQAVHNSKLARRLIVLQRHVNSTSCTRDAPPICDRTVSGTARSADVQSAGKGGAGDLGDHGDPGDTSAGVGKGPDGGEGAGTLVRPWASAGVDNRGAKSGSRQFKGAHEGVTTTDRVISHVGSGEAWKQSHGSRGAGQSGRAAGKNGGGAGGISGAAGKNGGGGAGGIGGGAELAGRLSEKLQGSFFRYLNEQLYTTDGASAYRLLQDQPHLFEEYHKGFRKQTEGWPQQPVDAAIAWLKERDSALVVADFGCGDARLAASVPQKVYSLDVVAATPDVIACNMAETPLETGSVDVAVFCLALMGTDYPTFLAEATRVLKKRGMLWIAEVRSRFAGANSDENFGPFLAALKGLGFELRQRDTENRMFVTFIFQKKSKVASPGDGARIAWPELKPCIYKRR